MYRFHRYRMILSMLYNKSVNCILYASLICVLTPFTAKATVKTVKAVEIPKEIECPELKDKEEALEVFLEAESLGVRLSHETRSIFANCFKSDDFAAWDQMKIINSFEFDTCKKNKKDPNCIKVKYGVVGELSPGEALQKNKEVVYEEIELTIKNEAKIWEISGMEEVPPLVSKDGLLRFLETQKESHKNKNWISQLSKDAESL